MTKKIFTLMTLVVVIGMVLISCGTSSTTSPADETTPMQDDSSASEYAGKKILYVDSYHEGYAWSDGVTSGIHEILDDTGIELKIIRLDTKRNSDEAFGQAAGVKANAEIEAFQPDVVIASDDNAQKYLVVPFLKETELPVVFCGVNWDASAYGYPASNITGMIEVELPDQLADLLKGYAEGERIGYITIDTETERKIVATYNKLFFGGQMQPYWVTTQQEFMDTFVTAQQEVDILFMGNNAGSDKWDEEEMKQFVLKNSTIPTGSINGWMAPYSLLTLAKSSQEQGEWAAQVALQILDGTPISEIPIAENKRGQLIINLALADKLNIIFAPSLLKNAELLDE